MTKLKVENFGPIKSVDVSLGDLNILIGPQASGKSLFLELFKLVMDKNSIIETLRKYNYICQNRCGTSLGLLFWRGIAYVVQWRYKNRSFR